MNIEILYEDDDMLVANKPAGLLVIPDRFNADLASLNKVLERQLGQQIWVVHRLDRDTSGVICFAKNEQAHKYLSGLFEAHEVGKFYAGLVLGRVVPEEGRIESPIAEHPAVKGKMVVAKKGKASVTDYKVVAQWPLYSLVQFRIYTGRTHQIRVHMKHKGHPLFNDATYGGAHIVKGTVFTKYKQFVENCFKILPRHALHAKELGFIHPRTREKVMFDSALPDDMQQVIEKWRTYTGGMTKQLKEQLDGQ